VTPKPTSPPARRPGTAERLIEALFGAPAPLRVPAARWAARRGLHAHALAAAPEDGYVLARAGFFEQAAELSKPGSAGWLGAVAGLGQIGLLIESDTAVSLPRAERRWIASLATAWDTQAALQALGDDLPLEAAAVLLRRGDRVGADARLADLAASPEHWLINAALDASAGDWNNACDDIDRAFRERALAAPLGALGRAPRLDDFKGDVASGRTGGALISVVVAARNAAATLPMAIGSLLRQTWRDLEVLIIDDGSRDATAKVAADLARSDKRVRLLQTGTPAGAAAARNRGAADARGEFIAFHDADDWAHPERLERQARAADRPGAVASVSKHFRLGADGAPLSPRVFPLIRTCPISLLVRAGALRAAGRFEDEPVGTDSEYLARLDLLFGRPSVVRLDEVHIVAGWAGSSLSGADATGLVTAQGRALREAYERDWRLRHAERLREMVG
jgi:hypothetical protein